MMEKCHSKFIIAVAVIFLLFSVPLIYLLVYSEDFTIIDYEDKCSTDCSSLDMEVFEFKDEGFGVLECYCLDVLEKEVKRVW